MRAASRSRRADFVAGLDAAALDDARAALATRVLARLGGAGIVAGYLPIGAEIDPRPIMAAAAERGLTLALPIVTGREAPLRFVAWRPGDALTRGPLGVMQPAGDGGRDVAPNVILTPLVGFDRALRRLGQGAAHYDRAFAALPDARRIGVAWGVQEVAAVPAEPWDMPLHAVATEREWIAA